MCFHPLNVSGSLPAILNNPFGYEPHPLCQLAAQQVRAYVESQPQLLEDARRGKMMGVLVVERQAAGGAALKGSPQEPLGFLAAYSGLLAGRNDWEFFVPPVFDAQQPDGHFKQTERVISGINVEVAALEAMASPPLQQIAELKRQRKQLSEALQTWLFRQYRVLNGRGEEKDLIAVWRDYHTSPRLQQKYPLPPGGSGDCCAPKLLQYAFLHQMRPLQIAEFWMGPSPRGEVRHDGHYYPACRGKCLPILTFMLQGLDVEPEQQEHQPAGMLRVVYEDDALLVVVKPSGMLSVPGKTGAPSVATVLQERYGQVFMPHRLDMDTSGLMVVARQKEVYKHLQRQFFARVIYKRYVALVEGVVQGRGTISLPLRPDVMDRPRQVVDHLHGKQALTDYVVLSMQGRRTLVEFTPHTGRTHQLRVHSAHVEGLGAPIVGDVLYGQRAHRLCLHAAGLGFQHPLTGRQMSFEDPPSFGC